MSGLAFHPTQPLLAASLHNGSVRLWNYRMGVLVDRFEEHEGNSCPISILSVLISSIGPVRAVAIYPSRPLLASGGDDYKVKVWGRITFYPHPATRVDWSRRSQAAEQEMLIHASWSSRLYSYCSIPS